MVAGEFVGEGLVVGVGEVGVAVEDAGGFVAGVDEDVFVGEAGHFEGGHAALPGAEEVAGAAEFQVYFSEFEAVVVLFDGLEAFAGVVRGRFGKEEAIALVGAASDASAELVKLGEAEAVGGFDHHDGGVGHVDADFDDRGGYEDVESRLWKAVITASFRAGGQASVEESRRAGRGKSAG